MAAKKSTVSGRSGPSYYNDAIFVDWELSKDERTHFEGWIENYRDSMLEHLEAVCGPDTDRITIKWDDQNNCWCVWVQQRLLLHETKKFILAARGKSVFTALAHAIFKHGQCGGDYRSRVKATEERFTP